MALNAAEKKELDELRARATNAESAAEELTAANDELTSANENLSSANDDANVKIAEAVIEKQNAIDEAIEATEAARLTRVEQAKGGKADKSVSPAMPAAFDRGAYYSTCHSDGSEEYAQNGWFYDGAGKPLRPTRKPK